MPTAHFDREPVPTAGADRSIPVIVLRPVDTKAARDARDGGPARPAGVVGGCVAIGIALFIAMVVAVLLAMALAQQQLEPPTAEEMWTEAEDECVALSMLIEQWRLEHELAEIPDGIDGVQLCGVLGADASRMEADLAYFYPEDFTFHQGGVAPSGAECEYYFEITSTHPAGPPGQMRCYSNGEIEISY